MAAPIDNIPIMSRHLCQLNTLYRCRGLEKVSLKENDILSTHPGSDYLRNNIKKLRWRPRYYRYCLVRVQSLGREPNGSANLTLELDQFATQLQAVSDRGTISIHGWHMWGTNVFSQLGQVWRVSPVKSSWFMTRPVSVVHKQLGSIKPPNHKIRWSHSSHSEMDMVNPC